MEPGSLRQEVGTGREGHQARRRERRAQGQEQAGEEPGK